MRIFIGNINNEHNVNLKINPGSNDQQTYASKLS